jgi:hypothetical protein
MSKLATASAWAGLYVTCNHWRLRPKKDKYWWTSGSESTVVSFVVLCPPKVFRSLAGCLVQKDDAFKLTPCDTPGRSCPMPLAEQLNLKEGAFSVPWVYLSLRMSRT